MGPNLQDHVSLVFFLAFLLFSWTTASIMSGALIERVRLSAFLLLAVDARLGRLDPRRRLGLELRRLADDALRLPRRDRLARRARRRRRVHARRPAQPRAHGSASTTSTGRARAFRPHNTHMTLMGLMLIFTGFYGFYAACLVIQSTTFPGWLNIYLSPTTLGTIAMVITFGFAGGFTGGWFASKGDPFWTLSGGLAGVIAVSAGADVYHPSLAYLLSFTGGMLAVWVGGFIEKTAADRRRRRRGRRARLLRLLRRLPRRDLRRRLPDRDQQHRRVSFGGQLMGMMTFLPLGVPPGLRVSWVLKKLNLLRVPGGGRARGPRPGRVRAGLLPGVRAAPRGDRRPRRRGARGRPDPARGLPGHHERQPATKVGV